MKACSYGFPVDRELVLSQTRTVSSLVSRNRAKRKISSWSSDEGGDCNAEKGGKAGLETVEELEEEEQELDQIEMLLETYFMQLDQLFDRLQDMKENIEATAVWTSPCLRSCSLLLLSFTMHISGFACKHIHVLLLLLACLLGGRWGVRSLEGSRQTKDVSQDVLTFFVLLLRKHHWVYASGWVLTRGCLCCRRCWTLSLTITGTTLYG